MCVGNPILACCFMVYELKVTESGMFSANVKRGKALLQKMQCPNGNCTQTHCIMQHPRQPVVVRTFSEGVSQRRGILDRAENEGGNRDRNIDKQLEAALAESLAISLCCSYCKRSFGTGDELQIHQAGSCRIMHDTNCTGEIK